MDVKGFAIHRQSIHIPILKMSTIILDILEIPDKLFTPTQAFLHLTRRARTPHTPTNSLLSLG